MQLIIGAAAFVAGALMVVQPSGSLLAANPDVLATTPFSDWTIPGLLLAVVVGIGLLAAGTAEWNAASLASVFTAAAGTGLIAFEIVQLALIGWHPLQPVVMAAGLVIVLLVNFRVAGRPAVNRTNDDREDVP